MEAACLRSTHDRSRRAKSSGGGTLTTTSARRLRNRLRSPNAGAGARLIRLIGQAMVVAFVVVVLTFLLVRVVPGDPATAILGSKGSDAAKQALRESLNLNQPLYSQFLNYIADVIRGDLGRSFSGGGRSVMSIIGTSLSVTLPVVAITMVISTLIAVPLGLWTGLRRGAADLVTRAVMTVLLTLPPFFLGLLLLLTLALKTPLFPAGGWAGYWPENLQYAILPSLALAGYLVPILTRAVRAAAITASQQAWMEASYSRGLAPMRLAFAHVLPNSLLPVITLLGYNVGVLIASAVVVEAIFGLPGIGQELIAAVNQRDYPVIQGIALATALIIIAANLVADLIVGLADPRGRKSASDRS